MSEETQLTPAAHNLKLVGKRASRIAPVIAATTGEALTECPPPPENMSDRAKAHWLATLPGMIERRIVMQQDLQSWQIACECHGLYEESLETMQKEGYTVTTERGQVKHAAHAIMTKALEHYEKIARQFGMTPASRGKARSLSTRNEPTAKSRFFK